MAMGRAQVHTLGRFRREVSGGQKVSVGKRETRRGR